MGVSVGKQQLVFSQSDSIPGRDPDAAKCSGAPAHSQRSTGTQYPNQPVSVFKMPSEMKVYYKSTCSAKNRIGYFGHLI